ncbi:MAG: hypothetical protein A3E31_08130 [Candidatus Rokubacteria bacterium RIFCSPHIGHO2_12_FULL_73_22]|nr:MAG: hypothetical protein A3D33_06105 [Candidatus Rokubacteria bacterium RIFCSPHIGHO2_02_FULL_73_26]OGL03488.1 MAG: hypothetical protein A3E31_08130 [Candidatus Rokubacteria bacterium RIFCSPHIGHO2_12_FULL_73_22]OGL11584.1 MAG: hypothetical protein A3I14_10885 [Candidatus Rokubacteria bacterium RIFCSPLOWO2_02_FULL_73_56]
MARSVAEIQADIARTRTLIEEDVAALRGGLARRRWAPYAVVAGTVLAGVVLSRVPVLRLAGAGLRLLRMGLGAAVTAATVARLVRSRGPR